MIRCLNCSSDAWENVDKYRIKKEGMSICTSCGFVSYPERLAKGDLKEYYREQYRPPATIGNLFSGQRKLNYHAAFLKDVLEELKGKECVVFDTGAAIGMLLDWVRTVTGGKGKYLGSELTTTFKREAKHAYGLDLVDEFDTTQKYDLISSYKVAEHIPNVDKEIRKYVECLKEGGHLYISVPTWFNKLNNFGKSGFELEYYYHPDHINVWTTKTFESILRRCGAKVIKEDHYVYDSTYLCVRDDSIMGEEPHKESVEEVKSWLDRIKKAYMFAVDKQWDKSIAEWPNFPEAQIARFETNRKQIHEAGGFEAALKALKVSKEQCPDAWEIDHMHQDVLMRYGKWKDCVGEAERMLKRRAGDVKATNNIMQCFHQLAIRAEDKKEQERLYREAYKVAVYLDTVSMQSHHDAVNWMMYFRSKIPIEGE